MKGKKVQDITILEELRSAISTTKVLSAATLPNAGSPSDWDTITSLFEPLLQSSSFALENILFDPPLSAPVTSFLQVTADTQLFGSTVQITAEFSLDDSGNIQLVLNNSGGLLFSLSDLMDKGLMPSSYSYPQPGNWPNTPQFLAQVIFTSSNASLTLQCSIHEKWSIMGSGYVGVSNPTITISTVYAGGMSSSTVIASGSITDESSPEKSIGINVQLPTGISGWYTWLSAPVSFKEGKDYIIGFLNTLLDFTGSESIGNFIPQTFDNLLGNVELTYFGVQFDPNNSPHIYTIDITIATKAPWVIIDTDSLKLQLDEGITLTLHGGLDYGGGSPLELTYYGSLSGSATFNKNVAGKTPITASAQIPIPATNGQDWIIRLDSPKSEGKEFSLKALLEIVPVPGTGQDITSILPDGLLEQLNKIQVRYIEVKFKFEGSSFSVTHISFDLHSEDKWKLPMLESALYLEGIYMSMDIAIPYTKETTSGKIGGTIQIADGLVTIPVELSKGTSDENWSLNVTSNEIPLPSLSDLAPFMGDSIVTSSFPIGLPNLGDFSIYNLQLKWIIGGGLEHFGFTIQSSEDTNAWDLVPDYFVLSQLFIQLDIVNDDGERNVSGTILATTSLTIEAGSPGEYLIMSMEANKASSQAPWVFAGSLKQKVNFNKLLLALHLPQDLINILPAVDVTQFDLQIEPTSRSFSVATTVEFVDPASHGWEIADIGNTKIVLKDLQFGIQHYAESTILATQGNFEITKSSPGAQVHVAAIYQNGEWNFTGSFNNHSPELSLNEFLQDYLPIDTQNLPEIIISTIDVDIAKKELQHSGSPAQYHYNVDFSIAGELTYKSLTANAILNLKYDSNPAVQYTGTKITAEVDLFGLSFQIIAKYHTAGSPQEGVFDYELQLSYGGYTLAGNYIAGQTEGDYTVTFQFKGDLSLGHLINTLVEVATGEPATIPSPWSFINNISLSDFTFVYKKEKDPNGGSPAEFITSVGVQYPADANLGLDFGFLSIDQVSLIYYPDNNKKVDFKVTKGTFLGQNIVGLSEEEKPGWDLTKPEEAPQVPGMGDTVFKLKNLSMGQKVAIDGAFVPASVVQTFEKLSDAFAPSEDKDKLPTTLRFDKNYGWLIGSQFVLLGYIDISIVFYDPVIYGLAIAVSGGKFKGLEFQILYKKVSENIGVYQTNLTLPDYVRRQNFGAVAVTLPSMSLSIYTNGDFSIDLGFPHNGDFSRSFGLEFSIFTGAGGFYFAKLSNETATDYHLPVKQDGTPVDGQFNPVIAFGIGIKAGLGRSVDKGILKAELSLTLQAILEGVIAPYTPNTPPSPAEEDALYYRIKAQASVVGRIYGQIDFVIISASVDITAKAQVQMLIEAYREIQISFYAEVSASVTITISFGLFDISFGMSFSTSISEAFTIGSNSTAPWEQLHSPDRSAYYTPLDRIRDIVIPNMAWNAPMNGYPVKTLKLSFLSQLSAKYCEGSPGRESVAIAMLFIDSKDNSPDDTEFTKLSRAMLAWVFNAYFDANGGSPHEEILNQEVTIDDLNKIYAYLDQSAFKDGTEEPFSVDQILDHLFSTCFSSVTVKNPEAPGSPAEPKMVAAFPMFPIFKMNLPNGNTIDFSEYGKCDAPYLKKVKEYFKEMKVQYEDQAEKDYQLIDTVPKTLAEYMFVDYFLMIAKIGIQDAINGFKEVGIHIKESQALAGLCAQHNGYGIDIQELAFANRRKALKPGVNIKLPGLSDMYCVPNNVSTSLQDIASTFNVELSELAELNKGVAGLYADGTKLIYAFITNKTVQQILDELQTGDKHSFSNIAGTISRFTLHGLRIPDNSSPEKRIPLFEAIGQQFSATGLKVGDKVTLTVDGSPQPAWLNLENAAFEFNTDLINLITQLPGVPFTPQFILNPQNGANEVKRYHLEGKSFSLPDGVVWEHENPAVSPVVKSSSYLWAFPEKVQQFLLDRQSAAGSPEVIPALSLFFQSKLTAFSYTKPEPILDATWTTSVHVKIKQIPSVTKPGETEKFIYEVEGCGENEAMLLQDIVQKEPSIDNIHILYNQNKAKENNGKQVYGLESDIGAQLFLLQTNYSTVSNPGLQAAAPVYIETNLIGMSALKFITNLWECSIVRSGGYYLYYSSDNGGLPDHIFDESGNASITVVISHNIQQQAGAYQLPFYVNSVVVDEKYSPKEDNLFLQVYLTDAEQENYNPLLQDKFATVLPGTGVFKGSKANPSGGSSPSSIEDSLEELFNLIEYRIEIAGGIYGSNWALPTGPKKTNSGPIFSMSEVPERATAKNPWTYESVLPIYPFVNAAADNKDPYAANGQTAKIIFNFLDIFGNTLVPEEDGTQTQEIIVGYTDPIISIDQWINVSKHYEIIEDDASPGVALLKIRLNFDKSQYEGSPVNHEAALRDYDFYEKVFYQISQGDVDITVASTVSSNLINSGSSVKDLITDFVQQIMDFLKPLASPPVRSSDFIECELALEIDKTTVNTEKIFALHVAVEISRNTISNVDPQFRDDTDVLRAASFIPPDIYGTTSPAETALYEFVNALETAIPEMRVAVGKAKPQKKIHSPIKDQLLSDSENDTEGKEIWLIRYGSDSNSIKLSVENNPKYFAIKPLSTKLISRPDENNNKYVPIRVYKTGNYIGATTTEIKKKSYTGIDIELTAQNFLDGLDNFLSVKTSTLAWRLQNKYGTGCTYIPGGSPETYPDPQTCPFEAITKAKKDIAKAIAQQQLTNVLAGNGMNEGLETAQEALEQQLLIKLGKAYEFNSVVHTKVKVEQGFSAPTANFYGQLQTSNLNESKNKNTYQFTPSKISLTENNAKDPYLRTFFAVRQQSNSDGSNNVIDLIDEFKAGLDYHITSVEHDFEEVKDGYIASSWLTLVNPIVLSGETSPLSPLVETAIPVPLKIYPTAPSMILQEGKASYSNTQDKENAVTILNHTKLWDYTLNYNYVAARQDLIYLNIRFNTKSPLVLEDEAETDLFDALMQFNESSHAVMADLEKDDENAFKALQSYAWIVQQISMKWDNWFKYGEIRALAESEINFTIKESDEKGKLSVTISLLNGVLPDNSIPSIEIEGFDTNCVESSATSAKYEFVRKGSGSPGEYLQFVDRKNYSTRKVKLEKLDILEKENAWAGVSVHRNEELGGKPTEKVFRYVTPYIRFAQSYTPNLLSRTPINIIDLLATPPVDKIALGDLLMDFFEVAIIGNEAPIVQIECGYSYSLQKEISEGFIYLGPVIPILLTTPTSASLNTSPPAPLLKEVADACIDWLKNNQVIGIESTGRLMFTVSFFSSLSDQMRTPVLKLEGLYVNTQDIKMD